MHVGSLSLSLSLYRLQTSILTPFNTSPSPFVPPPSAPLAYDLLCMCHQFVPIDQLEEITRNALSLDVMEQEDELEAAGSRRTDRKNRNKVKHTHKNVVHYFEVK